ncbi:MAG: hypothetical protein US63_C0013G0010 [Candidatus Moranbacteria bacterium GW2011_GWC2_37_8]|nr:MAG: hypothetical protein US63_C0013G0010 [Candidatus Moranbacteria bacterium GW2011_GWC2_37_8]KKQ62299.1 MAG: hypothetical protein US82_C0014G0010 [Parcubacteria group bacterium GW2011_GWC1_38_22]KKQ80488.1 MAG: hypothetical protein UT03_C0023G0007 [Candidatus Moranbacteria bacterium GW2011_GWD2_38_7]
MLTKRDLLLLSFTTGFSVMVVELTASRIIAPILGSSIYTWTSVIGITLLGTSIGSHIGGNIIDKKNQLRVIANFFLAASALVLFIPAIASLSTFLILKVSTLWLATIIASLILFFIPAFLLGAIYPMIAKQYFQDIAKIGKNSGTLSASWSTGSILGTFLTGFVFTGYIGSEGTFISISILLFLCSIWLYVTKNLRLYATCFFLLLLVFFFSLKLSHRDNPTTVIHTESNYYDILVADKELPMLGKVRVLFLDAGSHNIESLSDAKFDSYVNFYPVFSVFNEDIRDIAMLGGGSLEMSDNFKNFYPNATVTTAEIDPEVTAIADKYFNASDYVIENTIAVDGRVFLAGSNKKYDVIFSDAYNSFISVPWHLATKEFFQLSKSRLNTDGMFAINFISPQTGNNVFYKSMFATFSSVYENYYVFVYGNNAQSIENIVLVGINSTVHPSNFQVKSKLLDVPGGENLADHLINASNIKDNNDSIIFTDNYAPIDRLMMPIINKYFTPYISIMNPKT